MAEGAGAARLVYLPPYSPDFNPIELVFSKFKGFLKSASARKGDQVRDVSPARAATVA